MSGGASAAGAITFGVLTMIDSVPVQMPEGMGNCYARTPLVAAPDMRQPDSMPPRIEAAGLGNFPLLVNKSAAACKAQPLGPTRLML